VYVTRPLTQHSLTNIQTLGLFGVKVGVTEAKGLVRVEIPAV
jgi:hypothetical protein